MNPNDPMPGRIVSWAADHELDNLRGLLVVRPGPNRSALVIRFLTEFGTEIFRFEANAGEIIHVEAPFDALPESYKARAARSGGHRGATVKLPGKMAFKRASDGLELVFLADCNAGVYAVPQAVELPRK